MLFIQPINVDEACRFVAKRHRHHRPPQGYKLCLAVNDGEKVVGVLIAGRPVARLMDDGLTLEVTRNCTDGTRNACSMLYGSCWRAAKAMGYRRQITYTLPEEGGSSLRAAGAVLVATTSGGRWVKTVDGERVSRRNDWPTGTKFRWEWNVPECGKRFRVEGDVADPVAAQPSLFDDLDWTRAGTDEEGRH